MAFTGLMAVAFQCMVLGAPAPPSDYPIAPVPFTAVHFQDGFWLPRLETNRTVTIPYCFSKCEETGRIENFKVAGGLSDKAWRGGAGFDDSDVSKIIEGAAYSLAVKPDAKLEAYLDQLIGYYAAAQEKDGFLYTYWTARHTVKDPKRVACRPEKERWDNIASAHQLYNAGHMYEAAVAHYQATGKRTLLEIALRNADLVCSEFNENGRRDPPGHQEIEIGLAKLYRVTGQKKYLDQAKFFLEQRGRATGRRLYGPYSQDHKPVVEQSEAVGHAVRANYMYAGMADVAALTGDSGYLQAVGRLWENVVGRKLYLTGGVGARGGGEAYGDDYELPNLTAYCETCAAIANCLWNHRMFLLHGDGKYIDVLERSLYNGVLSGIGLDGKSFFYPNPLESDGRHARSPWFGCACCPSNICRFMPSIPGYVYAVRGDELFVNLYVGGKADFELGRQKLTITQQTRYPWDGTISLRIEPQQPPTRFVLKLRIPGWAQGKPVPSDLYRYLDDHPEQPSLKLNGQPLPCQPTAGYVAIDRQWQSGDTVELSFPMPVRRVVAHPAVEDCRGKVALERGPIVFCVEHADVPQGKVLNLLLPDDAVLQSRFRPDLLSGVQVIEGTAQSTRFEKTADGGKRIQQQPVNFTAIPYYAWAHRGQGEMTVWLARSLEVARPLPAPTTASTAKASSSGGDPSALNDQREPKSSGDHSNKFLHWWPRKGTTEWVQYDLARPTEVRAVEVYWFDDTGRGECRIPESWRLLYRRDGQWLPVEEPSGFGCEKDKYNRCQFKPVTTDGLRIEVKLQPNWSAGIHEWRVEP